MLDIRWIFIIGTILAADLENNDKTVDVALESVLGLNNTDHIDNINFLDKVERVIGNIKSVLESKTSLQPSVDDVKLEKFTDFILNLIKRLNKYDNKDIDFFFTIFNNEIRKYHYKGCKFHELLENYSLRRFLSNIFNDLETQSAVAIKNKLEAIANQIENKQFNRNEKNIVEFVNSLYRHDDVEKFQKFLVDIDYYRLNTSKKNVDLVKIMKEGLRSIIFDYYSQLSNNVRAALKYQVNDFWHNLSKNFENSVPTNNTSTLKQKYNSRRLYNVIIENLKPEEEANKKRQVKNQSIYLFNSMKTTKSDEIEFKRLRNDKYINIDQTFQPDDSFISIKSQKMVAESGVQTITPIIYTTRRLETRRKQLTFKTLYPDLEPEWTSVIPVPSRRYMPARSLVHHHNVEEIKLIRKPGRMKGRHFIKRSGVTSTLGVGNPRVPRIKTKTVRVRHKMPVSRFRLHSRKSVRQLTTYKTKKQKLKRLHWGPHNKLGKSKRSRLGIRRQHVVFTQRPKSYRRPYTADSMISEEGLSIQDLPEIHTLKFRRSDANVTESNGLHQPITKSSDEIHNPTTLKDMFPYEKQKDFNDNDYVEKGQKRFQIKTRAIDKDLTATTVNAKTLEVNKSKNDLGADISTLSKQKYTTYSDRAHSSNETETELKKNDTNRFTPNKNTFESELKNNSNAITLENKKNTMKEPEKEEITFIYEENQPHKDTNEKYIKTDNDFKTFIEDYGNDLDEFKRYKENKGKNDVSVNIERDINMQNIITSKKTLIPTFTRSTTREPIFTSPSTIATTKSIFLLITPSLNKKQDPYRRDKTIFKTYFDPNQLKYIKKTRTKYTTTRRSVILGRYFNPDGVIIDSIEELKKEVAEAGNPNYEEDSQSVKESYAKL